MINQQEENTFKAIIGKLANDIEEMKGKVEGIISNQQKINTSLQEMTTAKKTGTPVNYMSADVAKKAINDNLNSRPNPVASIDEKSKEKINGLISASESLVESNEKIKPRKPLLKITIQEGKKAMWFGIILAGVFLIGFIITLVWAKNKVNSIYDQDYYWANRAYHAALLSDEEHPGENYHEVMLHFTNEPEKSKRVVDALEKHAQNYQEKKQYLLSFIGKKDSRDIRVLAWEMNNDEGWLLYRFYDEETERSIHVWPDKKVEETTDKIVTDLASAQKYSKRKIWTVIREATEAPTE